MAPDGYVSDADYSSSAASDRSSAPPSSQHDYRHTSSRPESVGKGPSAGKTQKITQEAAASSKVAQTSQKKGATLRAKSTATENNSANGDQKQRRKRRVEAYNLYLYKGTLSIVPQVLYFL
ncbi:hypothetical protein MAN_10555, partial [Metarhizium hybridum]